MSSRPEVAYQYDDKCDELMAIFSHQAVGGEFFSRNLVEAGIEQEQVWKAARAAQEPTEAVQESTIESKRSGRRTKGESKKEKGSVSAGEVSASEGETAPKEMTAMEKAEHALKVKKEEEERQAAIAGLSKRLVQNEKMVETMKETLLLVDLARLEKFAQSAATPGKFKLLSKDQRTEMLTFLMTEKVDYKEQNEDVNDEQARVFGKLAAVITDGFPKLNAWWWNAMISKTSPFANKVQFATRSLHEALKTARKKAQAEQSIRAKQNANKVKKELRAHPKSWQDEAKRTAKEAMQAVQEANEGVKSLWAEWEARVHDYVASRVENGEDKKTVCENLYIEYATGRSGNVADGAMVSMKKMFPVELRGWNKSKAEKAALASAEKEKEMADKEREAEKEYAARKREIDQKREAWKNDIREQVEDRIEWYVKAGVVPKGLTIDKKDLSTSSEMLRKFVCQQFVKSFEDRGSDANNANSDSIRLLKQMFPKEFSVGPAEGL